MNDYPWTWEDSACTDYLDPNNLHIEGLQARGFHPKRVLMLGCGDGRSMNAMAQRNPSVEFLGVDMNPDYIRRAQSSAPGNASYQASRFCDLFNWSGQKFDTILAIGVMGFLDAPNARALLSLSCRSLTDDGVLVVNFPNRMVYGARLVYRDAAACSGRDKDAALRVVQLIAAKHPSDAVRAYGDELLQNRHHEREHFLFAPVFAPMYDWELVDLAGKAGLAIIESCTSVMALEPDSPINSITDQYRVHLYGRKPLHNHGH